MRDPQLGINEKFETFLHTCGVSMDEYRFDIDEDEWEYYRDLYELINNRY